MVLFWLVVFLIAHVNGHANDSFVSSDPLSIPLHRHTDVVDSHGRRLSQVSDWPHDAPISHMLGSFFAYLWVGSPPQRVSVIVDTGSHHTAFPCVGCACGKHIDPPYDPSSSSTAQIERCFGGGKCYIKQAYSEGSSWHAYKVKDRVWVGGDKLPYPLTFSSAIPFLRNGNAVNEDDRSKEDKEREQRLSAYINSVSTTFNFGCQDKETGLFRSQQIDGIMGMSAKHDTLPFVLYKNKITKTRSFSMCFHKEGGVLTLGGYNPQYHLPTPAVNIQYAKLLQSSGWYTVRLVDIMMKDAKSGRRESLGVASSVYNSGRGVIIDSGTTDTYLPKEVTMKWNRLFSRMTNGMLYNNKQRELSPEELLSLPSLIYKFEGLGGRFIEIESPATAYTESIEAKYSKSKIDQKAFRVYTSEKSGSVLGSNFMVGYNVIFDIDKHRLGFAASQCEYQPSDRIVSLSRKTISDGDGDNSAGREKGAKKLGILGTTFLDAFSISDALAKLTRCPSDPGPKLPVPTPNDTDSDNKLGERFTTRLLHQGCSASCKVDQLLDKEMSMSERERKIKLGFVVKGAQVWQYNKCSKSDTAGSDGAHGNYTSNEYHKENVFKSEPCLTLCGRLNQGLMRGNDLNCKEGTWSHCNDQCQQTRYVPRDDGREGHSSGWTGALKAWWKYASGSSAGTKDDEASSSRYSSSHDETTCPKVLETRECHSHVCPSGVGDYNVAALLAVHPSKHLGLESINAYHRQELLMAISHILNVKDSYIHLPAVPEYRQDTGNDGNALKDGHSLSLFWRIEIRVRRALYGRGTREQADTIVEMLENEAFPSILSTVASAYLEEEDTHIPLLMNLLDRDDLTDSKGEEEKKIMKQSRWLTTNTISVRAVKSEELRRDPHVFRSKVSAPMNDPSSAYSTSNIVKYDQGDNQRGPNLRIQYQAFRYPTEWPSFVWSRAFLVMIIQVVVLSLFFVCSRIKTINNQTTNANGDGNGSGDRGMGSGFDPYKGVGVGRGGTYRAPSVGSVRRTVRNLAQTLRTDGRM